MLCHAFATLTFSHSGLISHSVPATLIFMSCLSLDPLLCFFCLKHSLLTWYIHLAFYVLFLKSTQVSDVFWLFYLIIYLIRQLTPEDTYSIPLSFPFIFHCMHHLLALYNLFIISNDYCLSPLIELKLRKRKIFCFICYIPNP